MGDICLSLYIVVSFIGMIVVYGTYIASRLDEEKDTVRSSPDVLIPLVCLGVWFGTLLILSSVAVLIGDISLVSLAIAGSLIVPIILFLALQFVIHRFDPAKEAQKMKPKRKRSYYDHLPY